MTLAILWLVLVSSVTYVCAEEAVCYGPGSIALSVILSILLTGILLVGLYYLWRKYRKPKELILETDPEKGEYAFDNPGFKDAAFNPINKSLDNSKNKWVQWSPLTVLTTKSDKKKTLDDTAIDGNTIKVVTLRSHDFTGLGFNICGNMKEGIYIKDVLHRGPASESGKLNAGDRINSVTINFEHMVYEDALTILSYASPYEVIIEVKGGKILHQTNPQTSHLTHPIYRSSSCIELLNGNSINRHLFPQDDHNSSNSTYSSLQKSRSNMTTLERKNSQSPQNLIKKQPISPKQLKNQLEQKIENQMQKTEAKLEKFGVRVLPEEKFLKNFELSQNDNNINLEKYPYDEKPQIKKREKKLNSEEIFFDRSNILNNSGVKRDCNGIPQEIPNYMMNAAVAARSNRKGSDDVEIPPKKSKGKAPSPPDESKKNLDEIHAVDELDAELPKTNIENFEEEIQVELRAKNLKDYNSDSDLEIDNQSSSVNTIELNSSDITIHHLEENEERQNRRTASTGDLTKIQRIRKSSNGTLERAQSLDITDTNIPSLTKKRRHEDVDIFGKVMMSKEPRLSLILDGLNTFQRNRLKKSTEWGNLEDAILNMNQEDESIQNLSLEKLDLSKKSEEIDALVNKINEIKRESLSMEIIEEPLKKVKNEIWPNFDLENVMNKSAIENDIEENPRLVSVIKRQRQPSEIQKPAIPIKKEHLLTKKSINKSDEIKIQPNLIDLTRNFIFSEKIANSHEEDEDTNVSDDIKVSRHSLVGSLERPKSDDAKMNVSNISVNLENETCKNEISDLYTTALDATLKTDQNENSKITISTPDIIKNVTITEAINKLNTEPSSLTLEILDEGNIRSEIDDSKNHSSLTYITEIQVLTPNNSTNISEIEIIPNGRNLDHEFENFVRNFETTIESNNEKFESLPKTIIENDPEKELHKIQSIAEEQLKKLPEMRFTTSSYESPKTPEKRSSIELLRSNFEKSPPKKNETVPKSRIPIATSGKTPPTSPERRDSRNLEVENDKEILELMQSSVHSTPKYQIKANKNVTVTSIRNNSKIPSGLPVLSGAGGRAGVPSKKLDDELVVQVSTNGGTESSFKQWVFSPENSVTNIVLSENKK